MEMDQMGVRSKMNFFQMRAPLMRRHLTQPSIVVYISHVTNYTVNNGVILSNKFSG